MFKVFAVDKTGKTVYTLESEEYDQKICERILKDIVNADKVIVVETEMNIAQFNNRINIHPNTSIRLLLCKE